MNDHMLQVLEFESIREQLAGEAACSLGVERALSLTPSVDEAYIQLRLDETSEARDLLARRGPIPFGGITDIRNQLRQAQIGGVLDASDLLDIASTAASSRRIKLFLQKSGREQYGLLTGLSDRIELFQNLENEVQKAIGSNGQVVDSASPELSRIRSPATLGGDAHSGQAQRDCQRAAAHSPARPCGCAAQRSLVYPGQG